jgi:hypothetical protein
MAQGATLAESRADFGPATTGQAWGGGKKKNTLYSLRYWQRRETTPKKHKMLAETEKCKANLFCTEANAVDSEHDHGSCFLYGRSLDPTWKLLHALKVSVVCRCSHKRASSLCQWCFTHTWRVRSCVCVISGTAANCRPLRRTATTTSSTSRQECFPRRCPYCLEMS